MKNILYYENTSSKLFSWQIFTHLEKGIKRLFVLSLSKPNPEN